MKLNIFALVAASFLGFIEVKADLTSSQKQTLLSLHREARDSLNAPDMKEINWDNTLANAAQVYFCYFCYFYYYYYYYNFFYS